MMEINPRCPVNASKNMTSRQMMLFCIEEFKRSKRAKVNLIWLEATGCSGNIISLMDGENPDIAFFMQQVVNLRYDNSLMVAQGEAAYEQFLAILETDFILVIEGAVATKDNGLYNIFAYYKGRHITVMEAVALAGAKARHVFAVGTCASYGGPSAARPNPSGSVSIPEFLKRQVIRVPGCPSHPDWVMGTIATTLAFGVPELDGQGRPLMFYGITIHDRCSRRSFFNKGRFAETLGEPECMFKLGCRGPVTRTDCPVRHWDGYVNWPIEDNTPCIGCAQEFFPDGMEPFVRY